MRILNKKSKGLFLDIGELSTLVAVTDQLKAPLSVEWVEEWTDNMPERLASLVEEHLDRKVGRFLNGHCAAYPASRFFRRFTAESGSKAKDPGYFPEVLQSQFRIDAGRSQHFALNLQTGTPYDPGRPFNSQKELLLCGAEKKELAGIQDKLVQALIFPVSLQLGTLSAFQGLRKYLMWRNVSKPCLMLELGLKSSQLFVISSEQIEQVRPISHGVDSIYPVIMEELGLKDEESARKLVLANSFDFNDMGAVLLKKILREMQASIGFFEVQTGQTIGSLVVTGLSGGLSWIEQSLAQSLSLEKLQVDFPVWLESEGVTLGERIHTASIENHWLGLFSLMLNLTNRENNGIPEKK